MMGICYSPSWTRTPARVADAMTPTWIDEEVSSSSKGATCEDITSSRSVSEGDEERGGEERPSLPDDSARAARPQGSRGGRTGRSATAREVATLGPGRGLGSWRCCIRVRDRRRWWRTRR